MSLNKILAVLVMCLPCFMSISDSHAVWYEGDKLGYIDNVTLNGRDFESFNDRKVEFYTEDLENVQVVISGILESESKNIPVDALNV
jgi:hypothetical protein